MHKYVGEESPNIVAVLSHLAEDYEAVGRTADAQRTLEAMHSAAERHPGNGHVAALLERAQATIEKIKAGPDASLRGVSVNGSSGLPLLCREYIQSPRASSEPPGSSSSIAA